MNSRVRRNATKCASLRMITRPKNYGKVIIMHKARITRITSFFWGKGGMA
jgi:hypothetical protein